MFRLFDEVTFVTEKPNEYNEYIPKAFVFDTGNKKQEKTALENISALFDEKFSIKNEGFTIALYRPPGHSSSGRHSSWKCLITIPDTNPEKNYIVEISTDELFLILKSCKWENGICQEKVFFAKNNNKLAVLTKNMLEYKTAIEDMKTRESVKNGKKTEKFTYGSNYLTLSENLYFFNSIYRYKLLDDVTFVYEKPTERQLFFDKKIFISYSNGSLKFSDYLKNLQNVLTLSNDSEFLQKCSHVFYFQFSYSLGESFPKKVIGHDNIEFSENWKDELHEFEIFLRKKIEEVLIEELSNPNPRQWMITHLLELFGITSFPHEIPSLSSKTIANLKLMKHFQLPLYH